MPFFLLFVAFPPTQSYHPRVYLHKDFNRKEPKSIDILFDGVIPYSEILFLFKIRVPHGKWLCEFKRSPFWNDRPLRSFVTTCAQLYFNHRQHHFLSCLRPFFVPSDAMADCCWVFTLPCRRENWASNSFSGVTRYVLLVV